VQACAVYSDIGPYIALLCNDAHATVDSIFRGDAAAALLHRYGKHTQREIYEEYIHGQEPNPANPPGFSTHELRSDGAAYPAVARGNELAWWQQGFDVNDSDVPNVIHQAASHGWHVFRPYSSGSEYHHLNFKERPHLTRHTRMRIFRLRVTLPT
jgi:hypothetical protein